MNTREIIILLFGVGIGLAVGFGFWTDQFTPTKDELRNGIENETTPAQDASSFQIGSIEGSLEDLILTRSDTSTMFQGKATFIPPKEVPKTIEVSYVDLDSGEAIPIAQALTLLPEQQEQSLEFSVETPPGKKPVVIRLQGPQRGQMHRLKLSNVETRTLN
jgi:hypothetical protein